MPKNKLLSPGKEKIDNSSSDYKWHDKMNKLFTAVPSLIFAALIISTNASAFCVIEVDESKDPADLEGYIKSMSCQWRCDDSDCPSGGMVTSHRKAKPMVFGEWTNPECGTEGAGWHKVGEGSCEKGTGEGIKGCATALVNIAGDC